MLQRKARAMCSECEPMANAAFESFSRFAANNGKFFVPVLSRDADVVEGIVKRAENDRTQSEFSVNPKEGGGMTQFVCHGPYKVPTTKQKVGRTISKTNISQCWSVGAALAKCAGCYVFGVRAGRGMTPLYVGKATKSFAQEAFAVDKLNKYHTGLSQYKKGTPVLFFLCPPPSKKGKTNLKHITALEKLLIQQGALANPHLINVHHNKIPKWGISGVLRSTTNKPSSPAKSFRDLMGFAG